ncbi:MAG: sulfatase [Gemmatimonadetes bacterium]|nr:sulfatase [Gemmatimonadota bacterium]
MKTRSKRRKPPKSPKTVKLLLVGLALLGCSREPAPRPNIFLITIESLRTDRVGAYGMKAPTTPGLDRIAKESTVYESAYSVTSWTLSSHATLMTGLYPTAHQVIEPRHRLKDSYETLAERLQDAGYQTAGAISGPFLRSPHNLNQGFELWDDSPAAVTQADAHSDITNPGLEESLVRFLRDERDGDRPFFLFAYVWDPHYDFLPPAPYDTMFVPPGAEPFDITNFEHNTAIDRGMPGSRLAYLISQYEGEIRYTDDFLSGIWDTLRELDLWEDTWIIVTADHAEEFFEHGYKGHKNNLYTESIHVPMIIKWPGSAPAAGRDARLTGLIDIPPTVLDYLGLLERNDAFHGRSLLAEPRGPNDPLFFELVTTFYGRDPDGKSEKRVTQWWATQMGDYKLISVPALGEDALFEIRQDPGEFRRIDADQPVTLERYLALLPPWQEAMKEVAREHGEPEMADLSNVDRERLKALGYIGN